METLRILVVEDDSGDLKLCQDSARWYSEEVGLSIEIVSARSLKESERLIDGKLDGAIVDLRLGPDGDEGNTVIEEIQARLLRVPIVVFTATPDSVTELPFVVKVLKKGEAKYDEAFETLRRLSRTGISRILGGHGLMEEKLYKVFVESFIPAAENWVANAEHYPARAERALLRYVLNHLLQLVEVEHEPFFPEEFYIYPPSTTAWKTGSLIRKSDSTEYYLILSPACDLVLRSNGKFKTDHVLIVAIDSRKFADCVGGISRKRNERELKRNMKCQHFNPESICHKELIERHQRQEEQDLARLFGNAHDLFHHWLPPCGEVFEGGFANFRNISSISKEELDESFRAPIALVAPAFVRDITARFASYYGRQGQPDLVSLSR